MRLRGTAPAMLNAANEVAVQAFLDLQIRFTTIAQAVDACLQALPVGAADSLEAVFDADERARAWTRDWLGRHALNPR